MKQITLEIPDGKTLKLKDGAYVIVDNNIMERIKTWEDVVAELGYDPSAAYKDAPKDILAYVKIRAIAQVLNEGWVPEFSEDECRYYPYYYYYTKKEWEALSEGERKQLGEMVLLVGGTSSLGSISGPFYVHSYSAWSDASSYLGARLAFKSRELAKYAGRQFFDIYKDFCFITE